MPQSSNLEERVRTLENKLWVGISIGSFLVAFFGIGGGFAYSSLRKTEDQLRDAQRQVDTLKEEIPTVKNEEDKAVVAFQAQLAKTAHEAVISETNDKFGAIKSWIQFAYCEAQYTGYMNINNVPTANGHWQRTMTEKYPVVLSDKPITYSDPTHRI
jgi:hypothetical protein